MNAFHPDSVALPHSYGTRKSHNVPIRPAPRLRPFSDPTPSSRRLKSCTEDPPPQFPPIHVVLHPDDANSKVLLAIGRAFLSVDNRAMTIKDLAEMVLNFGLVAQNVSAASQAITTYIRTHLHRCDVQQDIPLLLRHVLSGTDADDDLLPALYSRSGGAHCSTTSENRITNLRRGTMVWYLSRATGASCPFARAGIRLSDYGENGKIGPAGSIATERKREKMMERRTLDQACGQKRKRSLRSRATATALQDSATESETDHDEPPPKVKLTLRLKPLAKCMSSPSSQTQAPANTRNIIDLMTLADSPSSSSSDSESDSSMSIDDSDSYPQLCCTEQPEDSCPPPYPRSAVSIHSYTLSSRDEPCPSYISTAQPHRGSYCRSLSLADSVSSPPPESEDENGDVEEEALSIPRPRRNFYSFSDDEEEEEEEEEEDWDEEGEVDSGADGETLWESPGPRSPSAPLNTAPLPETRVKEEPRDVQGMLDAWDHFDSSVADAKVVEVIAQAAAVLNPDTIGGSMAASSGVKIESQDPWAWEPPLVQQHDWMLGMAEETIRIKQEEFDLGIDSLFPNVGDDSFELEDESVGREDTLATTMHRAKTTPPSESHASTSVPFFSWSSSSSAPPQTILKPPSAESPSPTPHPLTLPPPISSGAAALVQLIQSLSVQSPTTPTATCLSPCSDPPSQRSVVPIPAIPPSSLVLAPVQQSCVSPQAMKANSISCSKGNAEGIVVHTCQPCNPSISATQIEEISVYQMNLGPYLLLRRIDTDFVNLMPIVEWCGRGRGYPVLSMVPNAVVVGRGWGSEKVWGVWVPLEVAQSYVKDLDTRSTESVKDEVMEGLAVFLSDELVERFPSALKDFHRTNSSGRLLKQFGRSFESMITFAHAQAVAAAANNTASETNTAASGTCNGPMNPQKVIQEDSRQSWLQKETVFPVTGAFALGGVLTVGERERPGQHHRQEFFAQQYQHRRMASGKQDDYLDCVSPLSAKEEEMFQELCVFPGEEEKMKLEEKESRIEVGVVVEEQDDGMRKTVLSGKGGVAIVNASLDATIAGVTEIESLPLDESVGVQDVWPPPSKLLEEEKNGNADASRSKAAVTRTKATRAATISKVSEKQEQDRQEKHPSLRRSKRVADALAAQTQQQQQKTRPRKRPGSRNTLS